LIKEIRVNATLIEESQTLLDTSSYEYASTIATDEENDEIKLSFSG
jgi:hypothetical protein